ncbi:MAG: hypothetical protein GY856_50630, partial [bacterium]|nr:hypothetical protein [bacterium]
DQRSCGHYSRKLGRDYSVERPHAGQCGACYTFGSLHLAGRFRIADAYPADGLWEETNRTEVRAGVGIERKSQGASSGVLYDAEVVVDGGFAVRMTGENFSLWQVGVALQALRDLDARFVQIGGCKSRGMGNVRIRDPQVTFRFLNREQGRLTGARQVGAEFNYELPENDTVPVREKKDQEGKDLVEQDQDGLFRRVRYTGDAVDELCRELMNGPFHQYVNERR